MPIDSVGNQKTIQQIIDSTAKNSNQRNVGDLGKDEFIKLLVTQLQYQDPLNPVDDKEFISQMAQFSALEQMQNMNSNFSSMKAFGMIGKYVTAHVQNEHTFDVEQIEGEVTNVKMLKGQATLVVNGKDVSVDSVVDIRDNPYVHIIENQNIASFTGLIGQKVEGGIYDAKTGNYMSTFGKVGSIVRGPEEIYAILNGVKLDVHKLEDILNISDTEQIETYLQDNIGEKIPFVAKDNGTGHKVPTLGVLRSYTISEDGQVNIEVDELAVSVDFIRKISGDGKTE